MRQASVLRELTQEELELVSGGNITVTGDRWDIYDDRWFFEQYWEDQYWGDDNGGGGGGGEPAPAPDEAENEVIINLGFTRPLTAAEQVAVDSLRAQVLAVSAVINSLPSNSKITLSDGTTVTGAELKDIWANTDFMVNEVGTYYPNGTTRGEARYNDGDPMVSFNIDLLSEYRANFGIGGVDYLILHEIGHMTANSRAQLSVLNADNTYDGNDEAAHERLANDIAAAIANAGQIAIMSSPTHGYSPTIPTFQTDSAPPPPSTTYYYEYDLPWYYTQKYWHDLYV